MPPPEEEGKGSKLAKARVLLFGGLEEEGKINGSSQIRAC